MSVDSTKITTPSGFIVECREHLSRRDLRSINAIYYQNLENFDPKTRELKGIKKEMLDEVEDREIQAVVISIELPAESRTITDKAEIVDTILDWNREDSDPVMDRVNEVTGKKKEMESATVSPDSSSPESSQEI